MNLDAIQKCMDEGRKAASEKPGRYGGRYLARRYDKATKSEVFEVLSDDDPDLQYPHHNDLDIFAQATPRRVHGMGGARYWFNAEEATITVDLGDFIVTKVIPADGRPTLKVESRDGGKYPSPQTILDGLVGNLSFDPLAFSRMDPKGQVETLKRLVGLDFSALDRKKAAKADDRLLVGREVKQLQGQLKGMQQHPDAPREEVSIVKLSQDLQAARQKNSENAKARQDANAAATSRDKWETRVKEIEVELAEARKAVADWAKLARSKAQAIASLKDVDEQAIITQMSNAESINRKVRDNQNRIRVAQQLEQKEAAYDSLTKELQAVDTEKSRALESANFPVESLSFDETGVLVAGVPFQQASAAEQLRVSVAMGLAMNPKLKVMLIRDGSLLDAASMQMVAEMAAAENAQLWIERVATDDPCAVVIEDGAVARINPAAQKKLARV